MTLLRTTTLACAPLVALIVAACSSTVRNVQEGAGHGGDAAAGDPSVPAGAGSPTDGGTSGGDIGSSGGPAAGGEAGDGMGGSGGATDPNACAMECAVGLTCFQGRCVECTPDSTARCNENTPETCQDGAWVALAACSGDTPACVKGACGLAVVVGSFATVSTPLQMTDQFILVEHGFEYLPTSCSQDQSVCVTGGMYP